MKIYLVNILGL